MTMETTTYTALVVLEVEIEAPDRNDAEEMIDDHFGLGAGGEGVNVTSIKFTLNE